MSQGLDRDRRAGRERWHRNSGSGESEPFLRTRRRVRIAIAGDALKRKLKFSGRFALTSLAASLLLASPLASALGLGRLSVQSSLGEVLRAEIEVTSLTPEEQASLRIRVAPPESYRAANVDYNPVLPSTRAIVREARRRPPVRPPGQRSRRPGALRRRHPRDLVGDRPPGSRIHVAVRSAGDDPRRRDARARHRRRRR